MFAGHEVDDGGVVRMTAVADGCGRALETAGISRERDWMKWKIGRIDADFRNKQDLLTLLNELKTELASLRVQKIAGGSASKVTKMCVGFISRLWALEEDMRLEEWEHTPTEEIDEKTHADRATYDNQHFSPLHSQRCQVDRRLAAAADNTMHTRSWNGER